MASLDTYINAQNLANEDRPMEDTSLDILGLFGGGLASVLLGRGLLGKVPKRSLFDIAAAKSKAAGFKAPKDLVPLEAYTSEYLKKKIAQSDADLGLAKASSRLIESPNEAKASVGMQWLGRSEKPKKLEF